MLARRALGDVARLGARRAHDRKSAHGAVDCGTLPSIDVLDAPVSGGPHNIAAGGLTMFVGGPDDAAARVRPVLAAYGDPILHVGPLGAGGPSS